MQMPIRAQIFRLPCPLFPTDFLRLSCFLDLSVKNSGGQGANLSKDGANPPLPCALPRGSGQHAPRQQRAPARRRVVLGCQVSVMSRGTGRASCVWGHERKAHFGMVGTLADGSRGVMQTSRLVEFITMRISAYITTRRAGPRQMRSASKKREPEGCGRRYGKKMRACALKLFGPLVRETAERGY